MGKIKISYDEAVKLGLTKECSMCHEVKSVSEFSRNKTGKYGAESRCKACRANYNNQHYQEHRDSYEEAVKQGLTKECNKCHKVKSVIEFGRKKDGKYGAQSKCKACVAQYNKQYRQEHKQETAKYRQEHREEIANYLKQYNQTPQGKESNRKRQKQYRQEHKEKFAKYQKEYRQTPQGKENMRKGSQKRRALENKSFYQPFTQQDEELCLNFFNHRCPYTGKPLTDSEIHIDHITPLSDKDGVGATAPWNLIICDSSTNISKSNKPILEFINSLPNPEEVYNKIRGYIILQAKKYIDIIPEGDITLKTFNITFEELKEAI